MIRSGHIAEPPVNEAASTFSKARATIPDGVRSMECRRVAIVHTIAHHLNASTPGCPRARVKTKPMFLFMNSSSEQSAAPSVPAPGRRLQVREREDTQSCDKLIAITLSLSYQSHYRGSRNQHSQQPAD